MQYDFSLLANQKTRIEAKGKFLYYIGGTGMVKATMPGGDYLNMLPGQRIKNFDFKYFVLQDLSGAENRGTFWAGDFDFEDDSTRPRSGYSNFAYYGSARVQPDVTNRATVFQIRNTSSFQKMFINSLRLVGGNGTTSGMLMFQAPGVLTGSSVSPFLALNKTLGQANAACEFRSVGFDTDTVAATALLQEMMITASEEKVDIVQLGDDPIVLPPSGNICFLYGYTGQITIVAGKLRLLSGTTGATEFSMPITFYQY